MNIWSWVPDGARHQDLLTATVSRNVTMITTMCSLRHLYLLPASQWYVWDIIYRVITRTYSGKASFAFMASSTFKFSLLRVVQTGSGAHAAFYPMGIGVKRPGRESHHSPPTSAEVKKMWICTSYLLLLKFGGCKTYKFGASGSVVGWGTMLQA
jgi:hypothetical protein